MLNTSASLWLGVTYILGGAINICCLISQPSTALTDYQDDTAIIRASKNGRSIGTAPSSARFDRPAQATARKVAPHSRLNKDFTINYATRLRNRATFRKYVFPLVSWIFPGALALVGGTLPRFKRGLLFLVLAGTALAQTESQIESDEVKRIGSHLNCQCGGCNDNVNCMMSGGQCPFCKPARTKIFQMQRAGMNDSAVVASFVRDFGDKVFRPDPSSLFWLVPYLSLSAGSVLIAFILVRTRSRARKHTLIPASTGELPAESSGGTDSCFARYHEAIENALARLD
jgi:cytochrome c-type biogenesis protein CcmH/NrfF